jgi:YjjG family noncanonical pyrimidine nucleotidase
MIKAVFIDVDDTLLDFERACEEALKAGFEKFSIGPYRDTVVKTFLEITAELWKKLEKEEITYELLLKERFKSIFEKLGIDFDGLIFENFFRAFLFESAIEVDGAREMLDYLDGKYILCAASNGPHDQQINRLKNAGMLGYFSHCFISESIGASKPSSDFFSYAIKSLNEGRSEKILPREIMMIGDSLSSDMAGARSSGLISCFYDRKQTGDTKSIKVDYIIGNLREISEIL